MTRSASKRITILSGLAVFAVALPILLNWRSVYYAIYPKEQLWGSWKPVARATDARDANDVPPVLELETVELTKEGGTRVECRIRVDSATTPSGPPFLSTSCWSVAKHVVRDVPPRRAPRDCVAFPDLSTDESARPGPSNAAHSNAPEKSKGHPTVWARFRLDDDGRLILEHDEPFLPFGGRTLILERTRTGE